MKILIGTKNPGKIEGARQAFEKYFSGIEIEGISVASEVGDQPINEEIFQGAKNRVKNLKKYAKEKKIKVKCVQSNYEGKIVEYIQKSINKYDGIVINAGAYTHYSIAIKDALNAVNIPKVEVHISNIYNRQEEFRKKRKEPKI